MAASSAAPRVAESGIGPSGQSQDPPQLAEGAVVEAAGGGSEGHPGRDGLPPADRRFGAPECPWVFTT